MYTVHLYASGLEHFPYIDNFPSGYSPVCLQCVFATLRAAGVVTQILYFSHILTDFKVVTFYASVHDTAGWVTGRLSSL